MKKTTTIHLSGILFNIEEDAYEMLSQYLESIEKHFGDHPGKKEIVEDIENRITELLSEKLSATKQVITLIDIQDVIEIMGKAEDFGEQSSFQDEVRHTARKRFYRNPEDKILGGVCGGIAAYFDIDPLWIRLAWAILFFFFGTGFLFYLLLWIIIPEAKTPSQKLEMRGEKVNISNISKDISDDLNRLGQKASSRMSNRSSNKFVGFIQAMVQYFINFIYRAAKIVVKIFSILLLFLLSFIFIILMSVFFTDDYISIHSKAFNISFFLPDFFPSYADSVWFFISVVLLFGLPLLFLIGLLLRFIFNVKKKIKYVGRMVLVLWIIGWFLFFYSLVNVGKQFSQKSEQTSHMAYYTMPQKDILIRMKKNEDESSDDFKISIGKKIIYSSSNEQSIGVGFPSVVIKKSDDDSIRIKVTNTAFAENKSLAKRFAQNIFYTFNIQDTLIELACKYDIPKKDKFHFQQVEVIIEIPQGREVYFSKNMKNYLYEAENDIHAYTEDMVGKKWRMGPEFLQCIEQCDEISNMQRHQSSKILNKKKDKDDADE